MMINKKFWFYFLTPIFSIFLTLISLELLARVYLKYFSIPRSNYDYRIKQPQPYQNAPYFCVEFIDESFWQPNGWNTPKNTRLVIPNDFNGTFFNAMDGRRKTTNQPKEYRNSIYLFGGSTMYNGAVPDYHTIASNLQRRLNEAFGNQFIVRNFGATTVSTIQQLERLHTIDLLPDDVVIFYDGVNDIHHGMFYANHRKTIIERNNEVLNQMSFIRRYLFSLKDRSKLVQFVSDQWINRSIPKHLQNKYEVDKLCKSMSNQFIDSVVNARDYTKSKQALFFHFLQPHLFSDNSFTEYEDKLINNHYIVPRGKREAYILGYPTLVNATHELANSLHSFDISNILNHRKANEDYFLDSCHVNHKANQIIAYAIFEKLKLQLSSQNL